MYDMIKLYLQEKLKGSKRLVVKLDSKCDKHHEAPKITMNIFQKSF